MGVSASNETESASFEGKCSSTLTEHKDAVRCLTFSSDKKLLASGSGDGEIIVWNLKSLKPRCRIHKHDGEVTGLSFSPDSSMLLSSGRDKRVVLMDGKTGETLQKARGHDGPITHCAFSPDDNRLFATASEDKTVGLWQIREERMEKKELRRHSDVVFQVCFSPDRVILASCANDRRILLWNRNSGKIVGKMRDGISRVLTCQFSSDGLLIAAVLDGQRVRIWNSVTMTVVNVLEGHHTQPIVCCAYAPDGATLATGSGDRTYALWNTREANPAPLYHSKAHDSWVQCVAFSPDGRTLATGSDDQQIHLWT